MGSHLYIGHIFLVHLGVWNQALKTTIAIANPLAHTFPSTIPANTPNSTANLLLLISWLCDDKNQFLCGISVAVTGNPTQRKKVSTHRKPCQMCLKPSVSLSLLPKMSWTGPWKKKKHFPNFTPFGDRPSRSSESIGKSLHSFPIHIQNESTGVAWADSSVWTQTMWNLPFIDICLLCHLLVLSASTLQTVALHPICRRLCKDVDFWSLLWTFCIIFWRHFTVSCTCKPS